MRIHLYSNGRDIVDEKITLDQALALLEAQQDITEDGDSFIGFTAPEDEDAILQFIRHDQQNWLVDIPKVIDETYKGSFQAVIKHGLVLTLVTQFFMENTQLRKAIVQKDYRSMQEESKNRWSIVFDFVAHSLD